MPPKGVQWIACIAKEAHAMSPTLLEGLLFLLLAALLAAYIGTLVFAWRARRRGAPAEHRPASLPKPDPDRIATPRGPHAAAEREEHHVS
jgi:cbb3-type cytochrome oxidase subunit 3